MDYTEMLKPDLVTLANSRGVDSSGTKDEIVQRLQDNDAAQVQPATQPQQTPDTNQIAPDPNLPQAEAQQEEYVRGEPQGPLPAPVTVVTPVQGSDGPRSIMDIPDFQ